MRKASERGVPLISPPGSGALHIRDTRQNALSLAPVTYNPRMKFRTLWLVILAAVSCGLPAWSEDAATPGYHVEIIVFRANSAQGGGENWSSEAGSGNTVGEESSSSSSQVGHFISALTSDQL